MNNKKHIIWSDLDLNIDDWRGAYAEFVEDNNLDDDPEDEYGIYSFMVETNGFYLDDERMNLDIDIFQPIIAIADLGLWNGRVSGYKELNSYNIKDCLNGFDSCEYHEWYVDERGDLRCKAVHHDGTNYILYRTYRDGMTSTQRYDFLDKIYNGTVTQEDIDGATRRLGDEIAAVYGWELDER